MGAPTEAPTEAPTKAPAEETTTAEVEPLFPVGAEGVATQYFELVVKSQTTIEWDEDLEDSSSELFKTKAAELVQVLESENGLSENALGFDVVIEVLSFSVSNGRKRAVGFAEAEIQYSGETSFPSQNTAPSLQEALVAATDAAAEDNDILSGATVVEEQINNNSSKLIPSILTLFISMIIINF